jgi:putative heme-binding domain-containing protein
VLSALAKLGGLTNEVVASTLADPLPGNREVALRFAEPRLFDPGVRAAAVKLADDSSAMVRFQLALSAGELPEGDRPAVLAKLADADGESPWTRAAVLSSAHEMEAGLAARRATTPGGRAVARAAAGVVGGRGDPAEVGRVLAAAADGDPELLDALARGMKAGAFAKLLAAPPPPARPAVEKLRAMFDAAARVVGDDAAPPAARVAAAKALAFAADTPALTAALGKPAPGEVQTAIIRALAGRPAAAPDIAAAWPRLSPLARTAAADVLASTPTGANALLDAVAAGKVKPAEVGAARAAALRNHRDAGVKKRAEKLLVAGKARAGVVADYKAALELKGDAAAGAVVFKAQCAACHKLGNEGHEVGPNLLAVVPGKTGDDLLGAILDPNKEVDGRYIGYVATLADGRTLTGVIAAETAAGVTLRRADGAEEAVRRADLDALTSTGLSLMPEGLEQQMSKQQMADLVAYLRAATRPK